MPKIKEKQHLAESSKNIECATFRELVSESLFHKDDFLFFDKVACRLPISIVQFPRTRQLLDSVHCAVFEVKRWFV